jgi:SAM-dependent methyltransferase
MTTNSYPKLKNWADEDFGRLSKSAVAYFEAQFDDLLKDGKKRIVEIGFGNGALLTWLEQKGHTVYGVDIDSELLARAERRGFKVATSMMSLQMKEAIDLIVAIDVVEHIPQESLPALFSEFRQAMSTGGLAVLRFPNGDSPYGRYYQYGDRTHCTVIGSGMLKQLARETGFKVVYLGPPPNPSLTIGAARWVKHSILARIRAVADVWTSLVYFGGVRVTFAPNLVAIIKAT